MRVGVVGLYHLGCVTAACLTKFGHTVIAYDEDPQVTAKLNQCIPPIYEPRLIDFISSAKNSNILNFSSDPADLLDSDIIWIAYDTPVNELGHANVNNIIDKLTKLFPYFKQNIRVIISSQLPVGTTNKIKNIFQQKDNNKQIDFIYSPENLRLGKALDLFMYPDRIIMGIHSELSKSIIKDLLQPIADKIIWMSVESAEMTKHAINAFLATSIVFINELATLCEYFGADAYSVAQGLKSDLRIGEKAYLNPGGGFSGGTLARDVNYLKQLSELCHLDHNLFQSILLSNQKHSDWIQKKITENILELKGKKVAVLGLAYKPGTDALRHSIAIKISMWLNSQGAIVNAYDPTIKNLEPELEKIIYLQQDISSALHKVDAVIIGTECPEFMHIPIEQLVIEPYIFDMSGFLSKQLEGKNAIKYFKVGGNNEITQQKGHY